MDEEDIVFEEINELLYLGIMLSVKNYWSKEIGIRITKAKMKIFLKKKQKKLYAAIIRPTLTYGCKAWTITSNTEKRLR